MTGNKFLLDTNIIIEVFRGNAVIADKVNELPEFHISATILGELYIGIMRAANKAKHLKKLNDFLQLCTVIPVDASTAAVYGANVAYLYKKGKPIPTNYIWIASVAMQHNLTLITSDKHFHDIDDLKMKKW